MRPLHDFILPQKDDNVKMADDVIRVEDDRAATWHVATAARCTVMCTRMTRKEGSHARYAHNGADVRGLRGGLWVSGATISAEGGPHTGALEGSTIGPWWAKLVQFTWGAA